MKKKYFGLLVLASLTFFLFAQEDSALLPEEKSIFTSGKVVKTFGSHDGDSFFTGVAIKTEKKETGTLMQNMVPLLEDSSVIFYNKKRKRGIKYPTGNLVVLENTKRDSRYYYHHLQDRKEALREDYKKDETIGYAGATGRADEPGLVFEVEDIRNKRFVNPLKFYTFNDTLAPRLYDLYFVDRNGDIVSLTKKRELRRGGRLFLHAKDSITTQKYYIEPVDYVSPYKISVFIDGKETSIITFDYLYKKEDRLTISDTNMTFNEFYSNNVDSNYFILDYTALPGWVSIKVVVQDIQGNEKRFIQSIRILPPEL